MRFLVITLGFFTAAALACGNPGMGCDEGGGCGKGGVPLIETISYALEEMGLEENADIRTAMRLYHKEMRTLSPKVPLEAFEDGKFYPETYAKNATQARAVEAQVDLLETIYMVLNDKQKKEFPLLMGMYQHHMQFASRSKGYGMCDKERGRCGFDPRETYGPDCPQPPRKKGITVKR